MSRRVIIWTLFFDCLSGSAQTAFHRERFGVVEVKEYLALTSFSLDRVVQLSREFLASHSSFHLIRFVVCTNQVDCRADPLRGKPTDWDFNSWKQAYMRETVQEPAAEMIAINNRAAVRIRLADGRIVERRIRGESSFSVVDGGWFGRLLAVKLRWLGTDSPPEAYLFVQTSTPWNLTEVQRLNRRFRSETGLRAELSVENGWCFPNDNGYPIYNRFVPHLTAPTLAEYRSQTRFYCGRNSCIQTGPAR